jgi:tripartite-type tricarboxylate transporter receptor subunit TctC
MCIQARRRSARVAVLIALGLCLGLTAPSGTAEAQGYPNRPVRIVVPAAAGGALDIIARLMAQKVGENWKHQLYVDNRPGANWIIGMDAVAKSPPDGYTLLVVASSGLTVNPYVFTNMPLDPLTDLVPIIVTTRTAFGLLLNPSVPARTVPEFIAYLRAHPGKLNHASNSATTMLASELFKMRANVDYVDVNFRGASQAVVATQSGTTEFCFVDLGTASAAIESKTLLPLAVTSPTRYELAPDIPTLAEQGLPGYSVSSMTLLLAPANTPAELLDKLNGAAQQALESPDVSGKLRAISQAVAGGTRTQAIEEVRAEAQQWKQLISERNIQLAR